VPFHELRVHGRFGLSVSTLVKNLRDVYSKLRFITATIGNSMLQAHLPWSLGSFSSSPYAYGEA
jgi:hypothetical protein